MDSVATYFVQVRRPYRFVSPAPDAEFAAMIVAQDADVTSDEMNAVARELVDSGCRYAVCCGNDSSSWDDAIDFADIARRLYDSVTDDRVLLTTWHAEEPIDDVSKFFVMHTRFDGFEPRHYVILAIGDGELAKEAYARTRFLNGKRKEGKK